MRTLLGWITLPLFTISGNPNMFQLSLFVLTNTTAV